MHHSKTELHFISRIGWLRAAVLGANDGIISTASLIVGVAASSVDKNAILLTGIAGLVAGALSMAAGEYVSVSSQADTEKSDIAREKSELRDFPDAELDELQHIYIKRGLTPELALDVAKQLHGHDALGAHMRDELGLSEHTEAKPIQAAITSAITFACGAFLPLLALLLSPKDIVVWSVSISAIFFLALLGGLGAATGGSSLYKAIARVTFWGAIAMVVTAGIGKLFNAVV